MYIERESLLMVDYIRNACEDSKRLMISRY